MGAFLTLEYRENCTSMTFKSLIFITGTLTIFSLTACSTAQKNQENAKSPKEMSELYVDLGTSALMNEDNSGAVEHLRTAIKLYPKNAQAHNNLGLALLGLGRKEDAKSEFEQALSINPNFSDAQVNLGTWYFAKSDYLLAKKHYSKALENLEYKRRFLPMTSLGHIELIQSNNEDAKKWFFQALTDNPSYCLAHMLLGNLYERETKMEKAASEYKLSTRGVCIKNIEGLYQLGSVYTRLQDYSKARAQFQLIIDNYPNTALAEKASESLRNLP